VKSSKLIKLLAALLCVVIMFVSCGDSASVNPDTNGADALAGVAGIIPSLSDTTGTPDAEEPAPLTLSDFLEFVNNDKVFATVEDAPEGVVDIYENFYLVYDSSVDAMNQLTYSYEVVDIKSGTSVKKWEGTYDQAAPDKITYVEFLYDESDSIAIVGAITYEYGYYTEEMKDESYLIGDERSYVKNATVSIYDVYGNTVVENKKVVESYTGFIPTKDMASNVYDSMSTLPEYLLSLDGLTGYIFDQDGKFVKSISGMSLENFAYDYETEQLGYYTAAEFYGDSAIQVYDKATGKLVYNKVYDNMTRVYVLNDGKLLAQDIRPAYEGEDYDFSAMGEACVLTSYTIEFSVEDGKIVAKETPVELDRVYLMIARAGVIKNINDPSVIVKDKLENYGIAFKIVDKQLTGFTSLSNSVVFFDNDLNVVYEMEEVAPLSDNTPMFETLDNGYSYVEVEFGGNEYYAIYNENGEFVRYIESYETRLMNDFIVVEDVGIFDYDFKCLYEFGDNEEIEGYIGDSIIVSVYTPDDYDTSYDEERIEFYRLTLEVIEQVVENENDENETEGEGAEGEGTEGEDVEEEPQVELVKRIKRDKLIDIERLVACSDDDYIVLYNADEETYNLYNSEFELLFVSMHYINMSYNSYLDAYVMETVIKGENCTYIIK